MSSKYTYQKRKTLYIVNMMSIKIACLVFRRGNAMHFIHKNLCPGDKTGS